MKTIYIHVGYGKTGTSAIQACLKSNTERFLRRGVFALNRDLTDPQLGPQRYSSEREMMKALSRPNMEAETAQRLTQILERALSREKVEKVIWSHETLLLRSSLIGWIAKNLAGRACVVVVIYLRNHVDWIVAAFLQWGIKHKRNRGPIPTLESFVADYERQLDYLTILSDWENDIGRENLMIRSYDAIDDVVEDFFKICDVRIPANYDEERRRNAAPSLSSLSLFKIYNDQFEGAKRGKVLEDVLRRAGIADMELHPVDPWPLQFKKGILDSLAMRYAEQHDELARRHGLHLSASHKVAVERPLVPPEQSNTQLIAALTAMILHLHERLARLERRSKAMGGDQEAEAEAHEE